ncbi:MAG: VCBS repeat-containing protein, partial [Bacteroidota bacterium]
MRQYYRRVFKKYCQLKLRIAQNMSNGRFYQQSKKRQAQLLNRLKRYALNLERHGKFLTRCSLLGSVALFSQGLAAQSFTEVTNVASPFIYVNTNPDIPFGLTETVSRSNLDFVDIDGDGDLDAFVGENSGRIQYFENISTDSTFPDFVLRSTDNAFGITGIDSNADPEFVDIDKDGDFDLFSGDLDGTIYFFENIGDTDAPTFIQQTGLDNPFDGVDVGSYSKPTFADTDGDGDLDAFVGTSSGDLFFYENLESVTGVVPSFETNGVSNPFGFVRTGVRANPDLIDIDGDNDLDLFVGISSNRPLRYYENTSTDSTIPAFAAPVEDFFGLGQNSTSVDLNGFLAPKFVDIDSDGDFDLFTGNSNGTTSYYQNTATDSSVPAFQGVQLDIEDYAVPEFVDIDGDGDLDLFVGEEEGYLNYFENISTDPNSPEFVERSTNNAFGIPYVYTYASPEFVDIDCDGDLDALIGESYGRVQYYENTSTDSA